MLKIIQKFLLAGFLSLFIVIPGQNLHAKEKSSSISNKEVHLTDLSHINITNESTKNLKTLEELIKHKRPKALYLEQWITLEPHNKKILKKIYKLAKKYNSKFYLVIGKNIWIGTRGVANTLAAYDMYGKHVDGIVLRLEPNKINVWKDEFKVQILNQMLDAYSGIYHEAKKRKKNFIVEFPFWFSDFQGPLKSFSQDACDYSDKVSFIIDNLELLDTLKTKWNNITCIYNINLTKRVTELSEEVIEETYRKLKRNLTFYSNFNGFIIDSDITIIEDPEDEISTIKHIP